MIAASQYPDPAIVRMSDFKTNEYATLLGGKQWEPHEENPMLGFRGASRYYSDRYEDGFALECRAIRKAREEIGLDNIIVMIPFVPQPRRGRPRDRRAGQAWARARQGRPPGLHDVRGALERVLGRASSPSASTGSRSAATT